MVARRQLLTIALAAAAAGGAMASADDSTHPAEERAGRQKPRIMFYHDGRHPLIYMYEPPIQKEEFAAAVDELVGTPIDPHFPDELPRFGMQFAPHPSRQGI